MGRYREVYNIISEMVDDKKLTFKGTRSYESYADLDVFILKLFGYLEKNETFRNRRLQIRVCRAAASKMQADLDFGRLNLDWLAGPHASTVLKAKMVKEGIHNE